MATWGWNDHGSKFLGSSPSEFKYATFAPGIILFMLMMIIPPTPGSNNYGQFGDGTTDDNATPSEVLSSNAMQPKWLGVTVTTNGSDGSVAVSGDFNTTTQIGIYDRDTVVNLNANFSSLGYVFTGWNGCPVLLCAFGNDERP